MPDYSNSKIYKVICSETQRVYIGSTTQSLRKRLWQHRSKPNSTLTNDFMNPNIFLIKEVCCDNKEQLHAIERQYIEKINCVNCQIPGQTIKEWYNKNKIKLLEDKKKYHILNRDKILQQQKERYKIKGDIYRENSKEYKKEWYQQNKEEYSKKTLCECGSEVTKYCLTRHKKSKKHQAFISQFK